METEMMDQHHAKMQDKLAAKQLAQAMASVKAQKPLVHNITNYVTVNDVANMLLAAGASPIMADDVRDALEITKICQALNVNIGTLNERTIPAMLGCAKQAKALGHPVVLDPVGAGASSLRTQTAKDILATGAVRLLKGNMSEMRALAQGTCSTRGVDAADGELAGLEQAEEAAMFAMDAAREQNCLVVITGPVDIVADKDQAYTIENGHPMMADVSGTGCMLAGVLAGYLAANPQRPLKAAAAAVCAMGICGEIAYDRMQPGQGNASYRMGILDAMYNLTPDVLQEKARIHKMKRPGRTEGSNGTDGSQQDAAQR